jgi:hypothetical protein
VVVAILFTGAGIGMHWWVYGWTEAIDQIISALIGAGAFVGTFIVVFVWNFMRAPPEMERQVRDEHAEVRSALENKIRHLEGDLSQRPEPEFKVVRDNGLTLVEIRNHNCDAEFAVKIDLSRSNTHPLPRIPAFAQWADMSGDERKLIQAGGYDRFALFQTELAAHVFTKTNSFLWVDHGTPCQRRSTSWLITKHGESIPPSGEIEVVISSQPPMRGGSRVLRFGFQADEIWLLDEPQ